MSENNASPIRPTIHGVRSVMSENNASPIRPNLPEPEPLAGVPQLMPDIFSVYSEPAQVVLTCATRFHPHADGRVHGQPRTVALAGMQAPLKKF